MSLKAFHIVFITVSGLLGLLLTGLSVVQFSRGGDPMYLLWTLGGLISVVALFLYGMRFLRKLRNVSYL